MVLGREVGLEWVVGMSLRALMGKLCYKSMDNKDIAGWASEFWSLVIRYIPKISVPPKGWYGFVFRREEHATHILQMTWLKGHEILILKRMHLAFEPKIKGIIFMHLWVLLLGLPMAWWNLEAYAAICNHLGIFLHVGDKVLNGIVTQVERILLEIDMSRGLLEKLEIEWHGGSHHQTLDYWGIPFRFSRCKEVGHLLKHCTTLGSYPKKEDSQEEIMA